MLLFTIHDCKCPGANPFKSFINNSNLQSIQNFKAKYLGQNSGHCMLYAEQYLFAGLNTQQA